MSDRLAASQKSLHVFLGGTFDPVHRGHLLMAEHARQTLGAESAYLMPSGQPVHRTVTGRTAGQRLAMLELTLATEARLKIDCAEIASSEPSYTLTSLKRLRTELAESTPVVLVMGMDSLLGFHTWLGWREYLNYCHIFVCARPGYDLSLPSELSDWFALNQCSEVDVLKTQPYGKIFVSQSTHVDISATALRQSLSRPDHSPIQATDWLPSSVIDYIYTHQLYDVKQASI